ncbi:MAG: efflux RND transporter periplasmic adaptor subunit [Gammaproteobacteria bacterium]|nr:efflux RND transporter periplasmic adaptor subunit [Gammaproteobacteria bacterium]
MKRLHALFIIAGMLCLAWGPVQAAEEDHGAEDASAEEGPNGGRLLEDGDVTLELAIYEQGVPPEYRAWLSRDGDAVTQGAELSVELTRLGGQVDRFTFTHQGDYWLGKGVVEEPHSFDVTAKLALAGQDHQWTWESHEGRTEISAAMAGQAGIGTREAGPATIERRIISYGQLIANPETIAHIKARFPGLVKRVAASLGDTVQEGAVLATIESNESLQTYAIRAPFAGTVIQRNVNVGELAEAQSLFSVANLDTLWVELKIFPGQRQEIAVGQTVRIDSEGSQYQANIDHLLPSSNNAPFVIARTKIDNAQGNRTPGQLVSADIVVEKIDVPLAVENRALQSFRDWTVVFIRVDDSYEIRPLELGRSDGRFTEVLSGLNSGDTYVVENSYLIKADIEKSGASHDH